MSPNNSSHRRTPQPFQASGPDGLRVVTPFEEVLESLEREGFGMVLAVCTPEREIECKEVLQGLSARCESELNTTLKLTISKSEFRGFVVRVLSEHEIAIEAVMEAVSPTPAQRQARDDAYYTNLHFMMEMTAGVILAQEKSTFRG